MAFFDGVEFQLRSPDRQSLLVRISTGVKNNIDMRRHCQESLYSIQIAPLATGVERGETNFERSRFSGSKSFPVPNGRGCQYRAEQQHGRQPTRLQPTAVSIRHPLGGQQELGLGGVLGPKQAVERTD